MKTYIKRHSIEGFTLLEVIIIVIIVTILAVLAFPQYVKTVERTHAKEAEVILRTIHAAEKMYKYDYNIFTNAMSDITWVYIEDPNLNTQRGFDYSISSASASAFSAVATRRGGPNSGEVITIDENGTADNSGLTP
jgi:type IV pilus assembly protein PilE